jgi:ribosomal protein S18 acetylase RimI-like enzyme
VLRVDGAIIGYCSYALTSAPDELKLEQLYLLPALHGRGLGGMMLRHVEARARALGCTRVMLQVAKANAGSIAVYERAGYSIREPILIDIGGGYVMDDYVMAKALPAP